MREHRRKEHEAQRGSRARNVDITQLMEVVDDKSLKEELRTCKHFLVDSEMGSGRRKIYNFAMDILDPKYLLETLDVVFDSLKSAAKFNVPFGFVPKNVEDGIYK